MPVWCRLRDASRWQSLTERIRLQSGESSVQIWPVTNFVYPDKNKFLLFRTIKI